MFNSEKYWKFDERTLLLKSVGTTKSLFPAKFNEIPDAVLGGRRSGVYAFVKNGVYFLKYINGKFQIDRLWNFPKTVSGMPLPQRIDTAVTQVTTGTNFIFRGTKFYSCKDCLTFSTIQVYENISSYWPGIPNDTTAAVYLVFRGKYLFFKRDIYWSWDESSGQVDRGYPRNVSELLGKQRFRIFSEYIT